MRELIGGQWGEMSVKTAYLFQGWNCRGPAKYKDMLLDIGTEEIGHVEMLATMVARLLEGSPVEAQEQAASNPAVGSVLGGTRIADAIIAGMDSQHYIVSGLGATPNDSNGIPFMPAIEAAYTFLNHSQGTESQSGRWAHGRSMDGRGEFRFVEHVPAPGGAYSARSIRGCMGRRPDLCTRKPRRSKC